MFRTTLVRGVVSLAAVGSLWACDTAKSANPTAPSVAGPIPGVAITAPRLLEPSNGTQMTFQPGMTVTLLIENPSTTGQRSLWMTIELASDEQFNKIIHQADRVLPGPDGRTSYRLPDSLAAGNTYYWRTRAMDGANSGEYSGAWQFTVNNPVVIEPPQPYEPQGELKTNKPDFKSRNGTVSGTTNVVYRFEVSQSADFSALAAVITLPPGGNGETSMTLGDLAWEKTYYWRMYATDQVRNSPYSQTLSFKTPAAPKAPTTTPGGPLDPSVPLGPGGRAPDPSGGRLPLPGYGFSVVSAVARAYPAALQNSCQSSGGSWQFMDRVVDALRTYDTRWAYNGKRGNANDPSHDVVAYHFSGGPDANSTDVYIVDIIGGHCGSNPTAFWNDVSQVTWDSGNTGRWISRGRF